ncbi:PCRF domain-containing protein, partial [Tenacibaculum piscium]
MLDKLRIIKQRYDEISDLIIQPEVIMDQKRYVALSKEYKDLGKVVKKGEEYQSLTDAIEEAKEIIADGSDAEMTEMAKMEMDDAKKRIPVLEDEIKFMLIPKDPEDAKNAVVELRAGAGGD